MSSLVPSSREPMRLAAFAVKVSIALFTVGLVTAQIATVWADSKTEWFERLVISVACFAGLAGVKLLAKHMHTEPVAQREWDWLTIGAMLLILIAGLVKAPHRSNDVYAYGAYGRLVSEHSSSPYITRPSAFPNDPVIARMAPGWRNTRSVYGPLFTAISAIGMRVAGTSAVRERLWFQVLATIATALSALMLKRLSPNNWWLFALNPVTLVVVAHEGHNDAFIGLGVLSALWFIRSGFTSRANTEGERPAPARSTRARSPWAAHGAIGSLVLAASIKITVILAAPAVVMWLLLRFGWKRSLRIGAPWIISSVALFAAMGGTAAFGAFRGLRTFRSTTSLWNLHVVRELTDTAANEPGVLALSVPALALGLMGFAVLWRTWKTFGSVMPAQDHRRTESISHVVRNPCFVSLLLSPLLIFITLGLYVLPWYWGWLLAPAVLLPPRFRTIVFVAAAAHTVSYGAGTVLHGTSATMFQISRFLAPLVFVVAIGYSVFFPRRSKD